MPDKGRRRREELKSRSRRSGERRKLASKMKLKNGRKETCRKNQAVRQACSPQLAKTITSKTTPRMQMSSARWPKRSGEDIEKLEAGSKAGVEAVRSRLADLEDSEKGGRLHMGKTHLG